MSYFLGGGVLLHSHDFKGTKRHSPGYGNDCSKQIIGCSLCHFQGKKSTSGCRFTKGVPTNNAKNTWITIIC